MTLQTNKPKIQGITTDQISDDLMARYIDLIYTRTGIRISPQKKALLSNRIRRRLRKTGIPNFEEYLTHIKSLRPQDPEWDAFLQEVTTHETYLFRDEPQWDWFRNEFLANHAAKVRTGEGQRSLRIWSAACSTGDEAFTIACCIASSLPNFKNWNIQIVGTDIGIGAVGEAKEAIFGERAMHLVSEVDKRRFFTKDNQEKVWRAKPVLSEMTSFYPHNLLDPLKESPFDLVFLKNVLIYFDPPSKKKVLKNLRRVVTPGGLLVAGAAEGVADLIRDMTRMKPWLYQQPQK